MENWGLKVKFSILLMKSAGLFFWTYPLEPNPSSTLELGHLNPTLFDFGFLFVMGCMFQPKKKKGIRRRS